MAARVLRHLCHTLPTAHPSQRRSVRTWLRSAAATSSGLLALYGTFMPMALVMAIVPSGTSWRNTRTADAWARAE